MKKYRAIGDGISRVSYITTTVGSFSVVDLYMEWKIWSRCFGKVVVINGVSSSGKSTLSHYLSNFGFNIISLDSVRDKLLLDYADKHFKIPITQIKKFLSDTIIFLQQVALANPSAGSPGCQDEQFYSTTMVVVFFYSFCVLDDFVTSRGHHM